MSTRAASVINDVPQFGFLDETYQPLDGTLADKQSLSPIPYTGADRNIMCLQYAVNQGFKLKTGQKHCSYFQFADGSHDRTVGQVETYWTLANDGDEPNRNDLHSDNARIQEQQRRNVWNYKYEYDFGTNASAIEEQLGLARRERYESERASMPAQQGSNAAPPNTERASPQHRMPVVPSIPTSQTHG